MEKVLYVSFLDEGRWSGYRHKIHSQCLAINNIGFDTYLITVSKGSILFYRFYNGNEEIIYELKSPRKRFTENRNIIDEFYLHNLFLKEIVNLIDKKNINRVYFRRIVPLTPMLLKTIRMIKNRNVKTYYEYPTFPWESELLREKKYLFYVLDKLQYPLLKNIIDNIILVGVDEKKYKSPFKVISNSINVNKIPKIDKNKRENDDINMIGVANVNVFHGFDRMIEGLNIYYSNKHENYEKRKIFFHIVGELPTNLKLVELVIKYGLEKYVLFYGKREQEELTNLFNQMDLGIGCLGVHRKNVTHLNSLKNREYAARGIPFIFSENDTDFEREEALFVYKPKFDDSPIKVDEIIDFYDNITVDPTYIRKFSEKYLGWENQMKKVFY